MKNYRKTKLYKQLTSYTACELAEGFGEGENASQKDQLIAWQYIWDRGIWKSLQGFYGRTVHELIESGIISK
jgi:hypothetical protein